MWAMHSLGVHSLIASSPVTMEHVFETTRANVAQVRRTVVETITRSAGG